MMAPLPAIAVEGSWKENYTPLSVPNASKVSTLSPLLVNVIVLESTMVAEPLALVNDIEPGPVAPKPVGPVSPVGPV